jgi:hypothetical protein
MQFANARAEAPKAKTTFLVLLMRAAHKEIINIAR